MPQLSLYIDETTLKRLQTAAKLENVSVSRYVVRKLNETMDSSWPENYQKLFGAIDDETFHVDRVENFDTDIPREQL